MLIVKPATVNPVETACVLVGTEPQQIVGPCMLTQCACYTEYMR